MLPRFALLLCIVSSLSALDNFALAFSQAENEEVGARPYEMVWANRTKDAHPALIDFEGNLDDWQVEATDAVASFTKSREQQLWGKAVGKLVYRREGNQPVVTVRPPNPVAIPTPFDCVSLWIYGNNWAWATDASTPRVSITILLRDKDNKQVAIPMTEVRWKEWWVAHHKFSPQLQKQLADGATFEGVRVEKGRNQADRVLYFDNIAFYKESLPPLSFEPRRKRNLTLPAGQTVGTNTGPGVLPFPSREETILPTNLTKNYKTTVQPTNDPATIGKQSYTFRYKGDDGTLTYTYTPQTGQLDDVTACWEGRGTPFHPTTGGGLLFLDKKDNPLPADKYTLVSCSLENDVLTAVWEAQWENQKATVTYLFRLWGKSLVVDVRCQGGKVARFDVGHIEDVENPRLISIPYLTGQYSNRPNALVFGDLQQPLFLMPILDHCRSNASAFWFRNEVTKPDDSGKTQAFCNGGATYTPKTDGTRNPCFERLFLTVSPKFEEVLPNIPNEPSPWKHIAGTRLWQAHGASDRDRDFAVWKEVARYGMTKVVITDHETGWRDGGESFTFRTKTAPKRGGDPSQKEYAKKLIDLGFRYGIYNNYTDFAPVNEFWHEDMVSRRSDGNLQTAWARCYNPKPSRAVEYEAKLTPIIQEKFHLNTAYCDVHTCVMPWQYMDFDARVPGAGTFAATFYAYGEIMLHQKQTWNGPVYSEGGNHWYYVGLTDGNYGQDQSARLPVSPWLVDFDLRKIHPLCCNFGMGNLGMFYPSGTNLHETPEAWDLNLDRFLAATLAFGHTGFLVRQGGIESTVRSYYCLQAIHSRYALEDIAEIHYADADGKLLDTSAALATDIYKRRQIALRYTDGLEVYINGNPDETWNVLGKDLPPFGWLVNDPIKKELVAESVLQGSHRCDYVESPDYLYADGRGKLTRFSRLMCDGQLIANRRANGQFEVIPVRANAGKCKIFAIKLDGQNATATALDADGKEVGPAETRLSRGYVHILPVKDAFSYLVTPNGSPTTSLQSDRTVVVPGETVRVKGEQTHEFVVPKETTISSSTLLWQRFEDAWIDFLPLPIVDTNLRQNSDTLTLTLTPHFAQPTEATVQLQGVTKPCTLKPGTPTKLDFSISQVETGSTNEEHVCKLPLLVQTQQASLTKDYWLKLERQTVEVTELPTKYQTGQRLRTESQDRTNVNDVHPAKGSCGDTQRVGFFMHPPYREGPGYAFLVFDPITLPNHPKATFQCFVGKGNGSALGDGIWFCVAVIDETGKETLLAETTVKEHGWLPLTVDLGRFAGKTIRLKLITDCGPANDTVGDWGHWGDLRIESTEPVWTYSLHETPVRVKFEANAQYVHGLNANQLRTATKATLHLEGAGIGCAGQYISQGYLNGVSIGNIPACSGDERNGIFQKASISLPIEAIQKLDLTNRFEIKNPGEDSFKLRAVSLELELADGRHVSSKVTTPTYSQPATWKYAEGIGIPAKQNIQIEVRF